MQKLPSVTDFKQKAFELNKSGSYKKLGHAQNALAKTYGFKDYNAIKPYLTLVEKDNSKNTDNESFNFDLSSNFDSGKYFDEELPSEEITTVKELKNTIKDSLEYSDPSDMFGLLASPDIELGTGFKPVVGEKFFNTEDEAVAYELATGEWYKEIKNCSDDTKIIERFDKDGDFLPYTIYKK